MAVRYTERTLTSALPLARVQYSDFQVCRCQRGPVPARAISLRGIEFCKRCRHRPLHPAAKQTYENKVRRFHFGCCHAVAWVRRYCVFARRLSGLGEACFFSSIHGHSPTDLLFLFPPTHAETKCYIIMSRGCSSAKF